MGKQKSRQKKGVHYSSSAEIEAYGEIHRLFSSCPIPSKEILANLGLFLTRASMARMLFMHSLYQKIIHVHGVVMEFGVRWGQNHALFLTFRNIYEPQNISRRVIGFDTFEGFPSGTPEDADVDVTIAGEQLAKSHSEYYQDQSVSPEYEHYLDQLLAAHEKLAPRSHIRKYEVLKGDVVETLPKYLDSNPETIIALAYFDLALYEPTLECLKLIKGRLTKGSIIGFDELNMHEFPGETIAMMEVLGVNNYSLIRDPTVPYQSYVVFE